MKYLATILITFLLTNTFAQEGSGNDSAIFYSIINEHFKKNKVNCYLNINIEATEQNVEAFPTKICGNLKTIDTNLVSIKNVSFVREYSDSLIPFHTIHGIYSTPSSDLFRLVVSSDANVVGTRFAVVYRRKGKNKFKLVKSSVLMHWDRI